jgi:hypothetical protein
MPESNTPTRHGNGVGELAQSGDIDIGLKDLGKF